MKRKFSLFLNIAMLCLCVCAIAFGVYSVKQASLNVTGTIGFKAHNCELQVSGTKKGYALENGTDYQQTPVDLTMGAENATTGTVSGSGASGTISSISLGNLKFTDLTTEEIPPIVITLTFTNLSAFQVSATVLVGDVDNVMYTRQYVKNGGSDLSSIANHAEAVILAPTTEANKTVTFVITLKVSDIEKDVTDLSSLNITAYFAKYDEGNLSDETDDVEYLTYTLNSNKTAYSVASVEYPGYGAMASGDITIPAFVNNLPVTSMASGFTYCTSLTSITIPNSVTSIDSAFYGCESLTSITIPSSVTSIGGSTFQYCDSLTSITIPSGVTSIESSTFESCSSLTSIIIPEGVTSIGGNAFNGCTSLTSITIPSGVTSIAGSAFSDCSGLTGIIVDSNNTTYKSEGNAILTIDGKTLVAGCKNTIIPTSVTSIGDSAFSGGTDLTSISLPSSVKSIGKLAFYGCTSLSSITIPSSVTSIGYYAFNGCTGLTDVIFADTSKTWTVKNGSTVINSNVDVSAPANNATNLTGQYKTYSWTKN